MIDSGINLLLKELVSLNDSIDEKLYGYGEVNYKEVKYPKMEDSEFDVVSIEKLDELIDNIQNELKNYIDSSRKKHWIQVIFQLCDDIKELIAVDEPIETFAKFNITDFQNDNFHSLNYDPEKTNEDFEKLQQAGTERKRELAENAREEIEELEEKIKQLVTLLQGFVE